MIEVFGENIYIPQTPTLRLRLIIYLNVLCELQHGSVMKG